MKCPHCDESIAVRLDKPGKKAERRRILRARRAARLRDVVTAAPASEEEE